MSCSYKNCNFECYESEDSCIFHSSKKTWKDDKGWKKDKVTSFWKELNRLLKDPSFTNNNIEKKITRYSNAVEEKIKMIFGCIIPPLLDISNLDNEVKHYYFDDCTFLDDFTIETYLTLSLKSEFNFSQCLFNGKFEIKLDNGVCQNSIELRGNRHLGDIHFHGFFNEKVVIANLQKENETDEIDILFGPSLIIFTSSYKYLELSDLDRSNIRDIKFWFTNIDKLVIANRESKLTNINSLSMQDSTLDKISILDLKLNSFYLCDIDFIENSKVLFERIEANDFKIKNITQDAKHIQFYHLNILNSFVTNRVEFKNTYFNDFNISKAKKIIMKTSFIDSSLNSIEWGDFSDIDSSKDIFRQLKFVNDKQGNHIDANNFYMMEMHKYRESIRNGKIQDRVLFYVNNIISNFGQSWLRPLFIYLGLGLIFSLFVFYCYPTNNNMISTDNNVTLSEIIIDAYNPVSKNILEKYSYLGLIYKVISGLIIYQLVIALRRQTKR